MYIRVIIIYIIILINTLNIFLVSCKKTEDPPEIILPSYEIVAAEDEPSTYVEISIRLTHSVEKTVSVTYSASDVSAVKNANYTLQEGDLVFSPGEIVRKIKVGIIHDTASKSDVSFILRFSDPVNSKLINNELTVKIINVDFSTLVWSDEFDAASLNSASWNYEKGAGGWGNNEMQTYTNSTENVRLESGFLHITAHNSAPSYYTSGRITTQGKREFTYGRIDIRAKLPEGQGIWPALWMLGANFSSAGWPACGEIDIMEYLGHQPSTVHGTIHWNSGGHKSRTASTSLLNDKFSAGFHNFSLVWTPNTFHWFVDGEKFFRINASEITGFPMGAPQFFIFNVAVGGNWPGKPDETTVFPQSMIVDYVRVYQ